MTGRLSGRVAIVTGGASGLGEGTVRRFAREGAHVLIADIQDDRGRRVAEEIGAAAIYQHTDVRDEASIAAAVDRAVAEFGRLDCMFANAGIVGAVGPIDTLVVEECDLTLAVNLRGPLLCMKHAARVMKPNRSGVILACSSIAALRGGLGPHAYTAAKTALIGLVRNVAVELAPHGIRVNCIVPGNMATEMVAGLVFGDPDKVGEIESSLAAGSPLPGRAGHPDDIAKAALYLASDDAEFVTGHTLVVDAGLTIGAGQAMPLFGERAPLVREAGRRGLPED